jgi:hypothetical protein
LGHHTAASNTKLYPPDNLQADKINKREEAKFSSKNSSFVRGGPDNRTDSKKDQEKEEKHSNEGRVKNCENSDTIFLRTSYRSHDNESESQELSQLLDRVAFGCRSCARTSIQIHRCGYRRHHLVICAPVKSSGLQKRNYRGSSAAGTTGPEGFQYQLD